MKQKQLKQTFFEKVYMLTMTIPAGKVTTYGHLAKALDTKDARRVGHALHANSNPKIPCHRVVNKEGRLAPNYAFGGAGIQKQKLASEGITFLKNGNVNLSRHLWNS